MTIKHLFPISKPTLDLNFAATRQLDPRITFSRASYGTYVDSDGLIKTAVTDAPRFDHDPVTGESLGLLIEESRTNLVDNSDTPIMASIGVDPPSVSTVSNQVLPSGEIGSVIFVVYGSGDSRARLVVSGSFTGNYWGSIYWKLKDGGTWTRIEKVVSNGGNFLYADFFPSVLGIPEGSEVYFTFGQVELGSFPTSYIPTSGSAVTRAIDVASIEGTNFSSWYNQSEGTVFADASAANAAINQYIFHTYGASPNNNRSAYYLNSSNRPSAAWINNGTTQALLQSATPVSGFEGAAFKYAAAYNTNDFVVGYNGGSFIYRTSGTPDPTINVANIGSFGGSIYVLNGHIARLAYFPTRLPDEQLEALTS